MKQNITRAAAGALAVAGAALLLNTGGCRREIAFDPGPGGEDGKAMTFVLDIPGSTLPDTRSMDGEKEYAVERVDVLILKEQGGSFIYAGSKSTAVVENELVDGAYQARFNMTLDAGACKLFIVANPTQGLISAIGGLSPGAGIPAVLSALEFEHTGKWPAAADDYILLPMLAETGSIHVVPGAEISGINLVRALARIDVSVSDGVPFAPANIYLYNYNTKGRAASRWNDAGQLEPAAVTEPNLPADPGKNTGGSLLYTPSPGAKSYTGEIYTFESAAAGESDGPARLNATCLVIEGQYDGNTYFYRVDFTYDAGSGREGQYMPLLRNYRYVVRITEVAGIGYDSPAEALASYPVPSNLRVNTLSWNEGDLKDFEFNGQNFIGVSSSEITLDEQAYDETGSLNKIVVTTDYAPGWGVEKVTYEGGTPSEPWLSATGSFTGPRMKDDLWVKTTANTGPDERKGTVHLKAGRLRLGLNVTQTGVTSTNPFFEFVSVTPQSGDLPFDSPTDVTVRVRTNQPWKVVDGAGNEFHSTAQELSLTIPAMADPWGTVQTTLKVQCDDPLTDQPIATYTQTGYAFTGISFSPELTADKFVNKGETYEVTLAGIFPSPIALRLWDNTNGAELTDPSARPTIGADGKATFTVPNNGTGATRSISIQHAKNGTDWGEASAQAVEQEIGNFLLSNGTLVAMQEGALNGTSGAANMIWSHAMGIDDSRYQTASFYADPTAKFDKDTGCNAYYEGEEQGPVEGKTKWRLPSTTELLEMNLSKSKIPEFADILYKVGYFAKEEFPADPELYVLSLFTVMGGEILSTSKNNTYWIRCVRDPNP